MNLNINIPGAATKKLKIQSTKAGRKLVISTNFLPLFGFDADSLVTETVIGKGEGLVVALAFPLADEKYKKVYSREYKHRRNSPTETLLDIRSQSKLNLAFGDAQNVHITFEFGKITIRPIEDKYAARVKRAKNSEEAFSAFVACSSGVDAHSLHSNGFRIDTVLEYRPQEKRDSKNLSESGMLAFLENVPVKGTAFNEDIYTIDTDILSKEVKKHGTSLLSISLQCDDMSPLKTNKEKLRAVCDLSTTADMTLELIRIAAACQFPFILIEQVQGFLNNPYYSLLKLRLERDSYTVHTAVLDASRLSGASKRKRAYIFATSFPDTHFSFPEEGSSPTDFWDTFVKPHLADCRDVSHSKSIQDGYSGGRLRMITEQSLSFPTLLKSQRRMAKDTLVIFYKGKFLMPSEKMERVIMGIPEDFTLNTVSETIASEIYGQAVEYKSHGEIINSVKKHMREVSLLK